MVTKLDSPIFQTRQFDFFSFRIQETLEYYYARDGSSASLVSSRPHVQPEMEDPSDEGAKYEGRSSRKGKR
jgi:hypothetical protein